MFSKIILGIDPGYGRTGYGVIATEGSRIKYLDCGVIETDAKSLFSERLMAINRELKKIIKKYKPDLVSVEELFFYKNVTTAVKVGQARGVIILTAGLEKVPVVEYTPLQVKQAISGYGKAEKKQIQQMVKVFLGMREVPKPDDAADALAIAICAANSRNFGALRESC
jgi:crossover junction endodeoxyribonuclease RuvC